MISICIPVYNFDVRNLVGELTRQGNRSGIPYEIILIDDCSSSYFRKVNEEVTGKNTFVQLEKNEGRAKIRNLFPCHSKFGKLLYLDCDSSIISGDFLNNYIAAAGNYGSMVICGGTVYKEGIPPRNQRLRWKFGINRESLSSAVRRLTPFRFFMTNNFLIDRETLRKVKFDDRLAGYGHEDTLYGYHLMKNDINIAHIDNPVLHLCTETNSEYLAKTENSILNLVKILGFVGNDDEFKKKVRVLDAADKLGKMHLSVLYRILFYPVKPFLKGMLEKGFFRLWLFDIYKLGLLIQAKRN